MATDESKMWQHAPATRQIKTTTLPPVRRLTPLDQVEIQLPLRLQLFYFFILAAIETVLAFSVYGLINVGNISTTTLHIPVLLASLFFGRRQGTALGLYFGLLTIIKASNASFTPGDITFSIFTSGNPFGTIVMGIGMRGLFGYCSGYIFEQVKKMRPLWLSLILGTILACTLHSFFVLTAMGFFFPQLGLTGINTFINMLTPRHFFFYGLSCFLVLASYYANKHYNIGSNLSQAFFNVQHLFRNKRSVGILVFMILTCFIATGFARHFTGRMLMLIGKYNLTMTPEMMRAVNGWYLQFIAGMIAACFLITVVIFYFYNNTEIAIKNSHQDALTGILNKDALEKFVNALLAESDTPQSQGTFIMLDVDNFKEVNDTYGHPQGDRILIQVADILKLSSRHHDILGRMGGDEFGFYLAGKCTQVRLQRIAAALVENLREIRLPDGKNISCSIGIASYHGQKTFDDFYREADKALYLAKNSGRNRYSFYHYENVDGTPLHD